jgi:hypothetical protein
LDVLEQKPGALVDVPWGEEAPGATEDQAASSDIRGEPDVGPQPVELLFAEHLTLLLNHEGAKISNFSVKGALCGLAVRSIRVDVPGKKRSMTDPTGRLNIEIHRCDTGLRTSIRSSRPTTASRVFVGKTLEETSSALPVLFSICSTAQACACVSACEAALGWMPGPSVIWLRRLLVHAETVKEHLWRMLLDWPLFVDEPPAEEAMSKVMAGYLRLRSLLASPRDPMRIGADPDDPDVPAVVRALDELGWLSAQLVLGAYPADWLEQIQTPEDLCRWAGRTDTAPARLVRWVQAEGRASAGSNPVTELPRLTPGDLDPFLCGTEADRFVAAPLWQGKPRESSPFTRRREAAPVAALTSGLGNGLLPRLTAQLVELAYLQQTLRTSLTDLEASVEPLAGLAGEGAGIAQVPAARGLLVHRVKVKRDRIGDYRILAPTEWNFHPRGVAARGLSTLPPENRGTLERYAGLFVTAVDPCVDYHVTIS